MVFCQNDKVFPPRLRFPLRAGAAVAACIGLAASVWAGEKRDLTTFLIPEKVSLPGMLEGMKEAAPGDHLLGLVFQRACAQARTEDLPVLCEIFEKIPEHYTQSLIFPALAEVWLRGNGLATKPPVPKFPPLESSPVVPAGYPKNLQKALERYRQVAAPFENLKASAPAMRSFAAHRKEYYDLLARLVGPGPGPFTDQVLAFHWGSWCGTGSEVFRKPQAAALAVALVRDERWAEAAGALLQADFGKEASGADAVLAALLPDLEEVLAGALASQGLEEWPWDESLRIPLGQLLRRPGDARVETLIALTNHAHSDSLSSYYKALGKFVSPEPPGDVFSQYGADLFVAAELPDVRPEEFSADAQRRAAEFLAAQASRPISVEAALNLTEFWKKNRGPESGPALRQLLEHPSRKVAEAAAAALQERGVFVDVPPKLGPARYRIFVNDKPSSDLRLQWAVVSRNSARTSESTTTDDGILEIDRDLFLDPHRPVQRVKVHSSELPTLAHPWFEATLPPPPASDEVVPVNVMVKPLRVKLGLPRPHADFSGKTMEATLEGVRDSQESPGAYWGPAKISLPVSDTVEFERLMPGRFQFTLRLPGAVSWTGELEVGRTPERSVSLQRGSDVKYTLADFPDWALPVMTPELLKEGKRVPVDWERERKFFCGVPAGDYVLRFPSSADLRKRFKDQLKAGEEFPGMEVPFSVRADSPVTIDLGEIRRQ